MDACRQLIVHPDYDSPRWRRCPLELAFFESPDVTAEFLHALDDSLVEKVFQLLITDDIQSARDVISLGATCTRLRKFSEDPAIWQELAARHFRAPVHATVPRSDWKRLYQFNYEAFMHLVRDMGHRSIPTLAAGSAILVQL